MMEHVLLIQIAVSTKTKDVLAIMAEALLSTQLILSSSSLSHQTSVSKCSLLLQVYQKSLTYVMTRECGATMPETLGQTPFLYSVGYCFCVLSFCLLELNNALEHQRMDDHAIMKVLFKVTCVF